MTKNIVVSIFSSGKNVIHIKKNYISSVTRKALLIFVFSENSADCLLRIEPFEILNHFVNKLKKKKKKKKNKFIVCCNCSWHFKNYYTSLSYFVLRKQYYSSPKETSRMKYKTILSAKEENKNLYQWIYMNGERHNT